MQELCDLALSCQCSVQPFATVDACVTDLNTRTEALKSMAAANGLTFNQSCLDRQLRELHDGYGCSTEYTGEQACSVCAPVHGDLPVGATCREFGDYSDCAADLDCWGNRCINYCEGLAEGALCVGENFAILGVCGEGLYCNFNTSLCEPEGALGDDCQDFGCKNGLFCDEFGKCAPEPAANEPCQVICAGDLVCNDNICVDGAGEGQACPEGIDCAAGLECVCATGAPECQVDEFVCAAIEPAVCEYLATTP